MQVNHKLTYKFEVSARDLKLIRRALENEGPQGSELARILTKQVQRSLEDLRVHFESMINLEIKEEINQTTNKG